MMLSFLLAFHSCLCHAMAKSLESWAFVVLWEVKKFCGFKLSHHLLRNHSVKGIHSLLLSVNHSLGVINPKLYQQSRIGDGCPTMLRYTFCLYLIFWFLVKQHILWLFDGGCNLIADILLFTHTIHQRLQINQITLACHMSTASSWYGIQYR